jgi:cobalt-zinc-cadmium efflux system protein
MTHIHSHHGHHGRHDDTDERRLGVSLVLIAGLMVAELVAGTIAHSLALLSDAGHMLTDVAALGLSILALRLAARPARGAMTFGLGRAEILSAQVNGLTLLVLAGLIIYSAVGRLFSPPHVHAWLMVWVAAAGIVVTAAATAILARANRQSLNLEGSFQHLLTDLLAFAGTLAAGLVIALTGFQRADPLASLLVAAVMLRSAYGLIRSSVRVFLEAAPERLSPQQIGEALVAEPGVVEVHDLHVWEVTSGFTALSAHVLVARQTDCHEARRALERVLRERFGVEHTTLQVDHEGEELIDLEVSPAARGAQVSPSAAARHELARRAPPG